MDNDNMGLHDKVEQSFSDRRVEVINRFGFVNVSHPIGGGFYSEVMKATPKDEETKRTFGETVIVKSGKEDSQNQAYQLWQEYENLKDLRDVQLAVGIEPKDLYTPQPITFIRDGDIRATVMTEASGKALKDFESSLSIDDSLAIAIQESYFFSILEYSDTARTDIFLTMRDFQEGMNTFIDTRQPPKLKLIDWSVRVDSKDDLKKYRDNERLRASVTLARMLFGKSGQLRLENSSEVSKAKGTNFSIDINNLVKSDEFKNLDPSLKYVVVKGMGMLNGLPGGYGTHDEMLNDLLAVAKKVGLKDSYIPRALQDQFRDAKPAEFAINNDEQMVLPKLPERKPINREVIGVHLGMSIDTPNSWHGDHFMVFDDDDSKQPGRYTGEEMARFCANSTMEDYDYLTKAKAITSEQIQTRISLGRLLAAEYYLKRVFSPKLNNFGEMDEIFKSTVQSAVTESGNQAPTDDIIKNSIRKSVLYWQSHKNNIPTDTKLNTQQLTETQVYFEKLSQEYP